MKTLSSPRKRGSSKKTNMDPRLRGDDKRLGKIQQLHLVAPSVWAWRPGRAKKIARFLDGLICLFPFEPPYFERHSLRAISIGHPALYSSVATADSAPFRAGLHLKPNEKLLGLFLGSRMNIIHRHAATYIQAVNEVTRWMPDLRVIIPTFPAFVDTIQKYAQGLSVPYHIVTDPIQKPSAMRACDSALAVSGTVGLELAVANVPHVVGYKMNPLTYALARLLVRRGQFAHLANIILGRAAVPEFIQHDCTAGRLAGALAPLLQGSAAEAQRADFAAMRNMMGGEQSPADKAAGFILGLSSCTLLERT